MSFNILVVDDSQFVRKILRHSLETLFSDKDPLISEAINGKDALVQLINNKFDLILVDLTMPIMDGYQLLDEIKRLNMEIPTIVLSADVQEEAAIKVKQLGVLGFLKKPFNQDQAVELLTELKIL